MKTAKDLIEWLETLPEDEVVYVKFGMLRTKKNYASLLVGEEDDE